MPEGNNSMSVSVLFAFYDAIGVTPAGAAVATDAVTTVYHAVHGRGEVKATETCFFIWIE